MPRPASRVCVVVTTYARPDGLARLLDDLEANGTHEFDVRLYDDATPHPDPVLERRTAERGWRLRRADRTHGKREWWRWWNVILADLRSTGAELFLGLQDDMRLCERFVERGLRLWDGIRDPAKASLHLHLTAERADSDANGWTPARAMVVGDVTRTGWVDLSAFMAHRRMFDALGWRLRPVPRSRWRHGEGVGRCARCASSTARRPPRDSVGPDRWSSLP